MSEKIIVLETSGKWDSVENIKIKLFDNEKDAKEYCKKTTDDPMDEKYWRFAEIIDENTSYEPSRYKNF